jgi:hypothetical protein
MKLKTSLRWLLIAGVAVCIAAESSLRLVGAVDFPIYDVDDAIGYIPKPNQHGCFLNRRCWIFNDHSMGTAATWDPTLHPSVLLIGNSIVMGGNPYDQPQKLGPLVQRELGPDYSVWPIAAGGWTNLNESEYLARHPEVLRPDTFFVWEFMAGGLSQLSQWRGQYVFPSGHPICALWYVFRRYALGRIFNLDPDELPPRGAPASGNLARFEQQLAQMSSVSGRKNPGILLLYPGKEQLRLARAGQEWLPERQALEALSRSYGLRIVDVSRNPEWTEALYREDWHPTARGNSVLAHIIGVPAASLAATW